MDCPLLSLSLTLSLSHTHTHSHSGHTHSFLPSRASISEYSTFYRFKHVSRGQKSNQDPNHSNWIGQRQIHLKKHFLGNPNFPKNCQLEIRWLKKYHWCLMGSGCSTAAERTPSVKEVVGLKPRRVPGFFLISILSETLIHAPLGSATLLIFL